MPPPCRPSTWRSSPPACAGCACAPRTTSCPIAGVVARDASSRACCCRRGGRSGCAATSPAPRRRFTVAHEIGHHLLHSDGAAVLCRPADVETAHGDERAREREANRFAAELLMPEPMVRAAADRDGPDPIALAGRVRRLRRRDGLPVGHARLPAGAARRPAGRGRPVAGACKDRAAPADVSSAPHHRGGPAQMPITLPAQLDEPTVHRGITVVPLYPRRDPEAAYATLADGLRRGLRVTETGPDGTRARARGREPARRARAALRRRGARRGEAEPDPEPDGAGRAAVADADPGELRRGRPVADALGGVRCRGAHGRAGAAPAQGAGAGGRRTRPRRRPARGVAGDRRAVPPPRRRVTHRRPRRPVLAPRGRRCGSCATRSRPVPASAASFSSCPTGTRASTTCRGPTRTQSTTASCSTAT